MKKNINQSLQLDPRKLLLLTSLYFCQGLPFGFFVHFLPLYFRQEGAALHHVGLLSLLGIPWALKILWAPVVDRFYSDQWGRRRSWIIPCMVFMFIDLILLSLFSYPAHPKMLLILVFFFNLAAATQDIAVDGLAVELLGPKERGPGNSAQVGGYKAGMILGGGIFIAYVGRLGLEKIYLLMAGAIIFSLFIYLVYAPRELTVKYSTPIKTLSGLKRFFERPGTVWLLIFIFFYKFGESLGGSFFKVFLMDRGFSFKEIGMIVGTYGLFFSFAGSALGGFILVYMKRMSALAGFSFSQACMLMAMAWMARGEFSYECAVIINSLEHFCGGLVTTALFTFMMDITDKTIAGTQYTLLATLVTFGMGTASIAAGYLGEVFGYPVLFGLGGILVLPPLALLPRISRFIYQYDNIK